MVQPIHSQVLIDSLVMERLQLAHYQQLAQAIMFFKNYGSVAEGMKVYLPDTVIPCIVGNWFKPIRSPS